jgi:cytoskeletal protein CcmA (bactofilin family)
VNPSLATVLLVLLAAVLFALPLLPAVQELRLKHDAEPLNVIQQYAGEIRHFAYGFRNYIETIQQPLLHCVAQGTTATGTLPDGDEYLLLGGGDNLSLASGGKIKGSSCPLVLAVGRDTALPGGLTFLKEIYAAGHLVGGEQSTYRAILGEKDIHLRRASKLMRWAHAVGSFRADHDCDLYGRVSSDREIALESGCIFQRLNAPRIGMGSAAVAVEHAPSPESNLSIDRQIPDRPIGRRLIAGDFEIRSGEVISGNIVTRGKLRIGAGARVRGSVKSNKEMVVEAGVTVEGSLISAATMHIGPRCQIHGPVISEHGILIESGTECGSAETPTTVSAPIIDVEEGGQFFGTLWARDEGLVVPRR